MEKGHDRVVEPVRSVCPNVWISCYSHVLPPLLRLVTKLPSYLGRHICPETGGS